MKIALVYPPTSELNLKGYPLGLGYLSASLNKQHEVDIYNYNGKEFNPSIRLFLSTVRTKKPDLVGISFNSFNRWGAFKLLRQIKKIDRKILVVLGGVHPATLYEQTFKYFYHDLDFIIQSEGERSLPGLCQALKQGGDLSTISGLVYKDKDKGFLSNRVFGLVKDLDELALPDYSYAAEEIRQKKLAYLITSRGCPVNCSFCSTSSFWGQNVRMNSPERIAQEVEYVKRMGAKRIFFHDDTFNLGIDRTIKITEVLKKLDIEYAISCRVTPVNEEMVAKLADSGCRHITWGVETLSENILGKINKKITRELVKTAFDICAKFTDKMTTSAFFCVGTPGETEATIKETVDYANANIRSTHGAGASMLYVLPGTKVYSDLIKENKFDAKIWVKSGDVYYYTREHSMKTLNRWRKLVNHCGIKISYTVKYFWDLIPVALVQKKVLGSKRLAKTLNKVKRSFNLFLKRY
ncbi:MAG: radical SAM protein [Candidatus Omnitrophota bacterium]|nr:radical SAM protein [Candidatus Omnitrophota bacterium]